MMFIIVQHMTGTVEHTLEHTHARMAAVLLTRRMHISNLKLDLSTAVLFYIVGGKIYSESMSDGTFGRSHVYPYAYIRFSRILRPLLPILRYRRVRKIFRSECGEGWGWVEVRLGLGFKVMWKNI